jgi:predicted RecA/RadA family phage recombinase
MKNFVQPGLSVLLPMPYDRTSGQGVLVGALFGVVAVDALTGVSAEVAVNGVFDITKEAPLVIAVGARVFWDNTNKRVTTTATGNVAIGHAVVAAASADTTARVRLSGSTPAGT